MYSPELVYVAAWVMSLNEDENNHPGSVRWDPPAEMEQFEFLIGEWEGHGFISTLEDSTEREVVVRWRAQELLDGWAIQDEIRILSANGKLLSQSTLLRTYSADRGHWKVAELSIPDQQTTEFHAQRVGDSMIMHGKRKDHSSDHHIQFIYHDIYSDSFKVRMGLSTDGQNWSGPELRFVMKRK